MAYTPIPATSTGGGSGTSAGASGNVQYGDGAGGFLAEAALTYNAATNFLTVQHITGLSSPATSSEAATKAYVDAAIAGLAWKASVVAASTANGTLASAFENGDTLDGVTLATGDRILLKNQTAGAENGIYVVAASGAPTRATDADSAAELIDAAVFVQQGTANADKAFVCTNDSITLETTAIVFTAFASVVGALIAANNLSDLASASTARTNLGLGTLATQSGTFSGTSSGTNTGDQTVTLTGNVTGSGTGSFATTIAANAVALSMLATIAQQRIIGGAAGAGTATPTALTPAQIIGVIFGSSAVVADGNSGSTKTIDWTAGALHTLTLTANCTLTFTAPSFVGRFSLTITQDSTPRTITWPGSVRWPGGTAPTLSTGSGAVDKVTFEYNGTNYDGVANAGSSGAFA